MLKRTSLRPIAATIVLLATVAVIGNFVATHPELRAQLGKLSPALLLGLLGLYVVFTACLTLIHTAMIKLCRAKLAAGEIILVSMYSSVINFFGPLQSGPAFRAIYLKKKHGVKLKDYTAVTFAYYFFYALFSGLLLLSGLLKWWLIAVVALALLFITWLRRTSNPRLQGLKSIANSNWYLLAAASLAQVGLLAMIFYVELKSVAPAIQLSQVLIYTGAANFALFVSITPGAIGFRESFLLFTQRLHHIDSSTIVAANLIDRTVYVVLLVILAAFIFGTHAQRKLKLNSSES